ncbi:hypothetical protein, partial [Burkholderia vietnamiensis]|uniref:hypothetical protein n=1 Tax=Burkholderia vietnamiensis TaxID=60552 RepID=UPI001ADCE6D4
IEAMRKDGGGAHRAGRLAPCGRRWPGSRGHICALGEGAADFRETPHALRDHWLRDSEARCGAARPSSAFGNARPPQSIDIADFHVCSACTSRCIMTFDQAGHFYSRRPR